MKLYNVMGKDAKGKMLDVYVVTNGTMATAKALFRAKYEGEPTYCEKWADSILVDKNGGKK